MPDYSLANSTMSIGSLEMGQSGLPPSWLGLLMTVAVCVIMLSFIITALSNFKYYKRLKGFIRWVVGTVHYFFIGIGSLIVLAIPSSIVYFAVTQAKNGNVVPFKVTAYLLGGYLLISLIGWLAEKYIIKRVSTFEKKMKKEKSK